ncbi:unnamed protein product [Tuber melanosporum]|uniref:(Perigord truffle) hypothetical protein n=1 Tax=Tuber melanosporum (strain Mel28) TaxID=656061 RepID=D5G5J3_TUBMM|nr:uncharacterized protein GSTUM_00004364001 [Tuber melanosporum]CAZ79786.1 unnamed protein product [Tuber melanosporum]
MGANHCGVYLCMISGRGTTGSPGTQVLFALIPAR